MNGPVLASHLQQPPIRNPFFINPPRRVPGVNLRDEFNPMKSRRAGRPEDTREFSATALLRFVPDEQPFAPSHGMAILWPSSLARRPPPHASLGYVQPTHERRSSQPRPWRSPAACCGLWNTRAADATATRGCPAARCATRNACTGVIAHGSPCAAAETGTSTSQWHVSCRGKRNGVGG